MHVRPIIVLGPERSGTSLVAEMIDRWGAYVGEPDQLSAADHRNPRGYWEFKPLWDLAEKVGAFASGVTWWEQSFPERVRRNASDASLASEARSLIEQMERPGRPWMWKDPALCHFLPFWRHFWPDPVLVLTVRHPIAIAHSWHAFALGSPRRPTSIECNLLRWQYMATAALAAAEDNATNIFVEFEQLVEDPQEQASRLARALDNACGTKTGPETLAAMADSPQIGLRHHHRTSSDGLSHVQRALYDLQRAKTRGSNTRFDASDYPPPSGWRERVIDEERAAQPNPVELAPDTSERP